MAEVQHLIHVSDYEQRLMVNGLNAFRNDLIRDGKPTEDINALLIKVIDAPEKKPKRKIDRERLPCFWCKVWIVSKYREWRESTTEPNSFNRVSPIAYSNDS